LEIFMKAVLVDQESNLSWGEADRPQINADEILVKVHATAINRADLMQRRGMYPAPAGASEIMGLECAGEVVEIGESVSSWNVGDKICALLAGGGYAEYVAIPAINAMPIPSGLSMNEAAALPEVFATAWLNLFIEAALVPDEKVILHAGASGVVRRAFNFVRHLVTPVLSRLVTMKSWRRAFNLVRQQGVIGMRVRF
jgi:tumor protein p53-inducible protein 3